MGVVRGREVWQALRGAAPAAAFLVLVLLSAGCSARAGSGDSAGSSGTSTATPVVPPQPDTGTAGTGATGATGTAAVGAGVSSTADAALLTRLAAHPKGRRYPVHTRIVATTFWVGEIFDPNASDGSQVISTYDSGWLQHYGGCDGVMVSGDCRTEPRTARNGFFPTRMTPHQNPFYLDLPFDDLNDPQAFAQRASVVPWAREVRYARAADDPDASLMKNRWVRLTRSGRVCYGQIQDAGPGEYHDSRYVFGGDDRRPANRRYNGAGMDVSPALNGCLAFRELDGDQDLVGWQFVDDVDVPAGPWRRVVTTSAAS